jgi:UDP-2-acetamido-2-deoxy-ribo-hexuluronate aminotransferase
MRFNDLDLLNKRILKKLQVRSQKIFKKNNFIFGEEVHKLEKKLESITKSNYCISVGSGTDALLICLLSLNLKKNDEVLIPSFSWLSVVEVVLLVGAKPVFLETDNSNFNLDISCITKNINKKTKAIISTSLFGRTADLFKINKICKKNKIIHIEDAAQNFGSKLNNIDSCIIADMTCVSFFPSKNLGCFGDGGAIFTNSKKKSKTLKMLRNHGTEKYSQGKIIGLNSRIGTLQAGILLEKLKYFNKQINLQRRTYESYQNFFNSKNIKGFPISIKKDQNAYSHFNLMVKNRKKLTKYLVKFKVPFKIYYSTPLYKQYNLNIKFNCNVTNKICKNIISLPFNFVDLKRHKNTLNILNKIIAMDRKIFE